MSRVPARVLVTVVAGVLTLAACGPGGPPAEPDMPSPTVDMSSMPPIPPPSNPPETAPPPAAAVPEWKAPFDDVPYAAGDMLVGMVFPADERSDLSIIGVDPSGSTRWAVRTNPSCVGYGVTRAGDRAVAVVLASDADNRNGVLATATTASAYDARDGSRVWGPSAVPGPMQGPGLIFGKNGPSAVGDQRSPKVMLAALTGQPVSPPMKGALPLYEHDGVGLFGRDGTVTAVGTRTGTVLWTSGRLELPSPVGGPVELLDATGASEGGVIALRWSAREPGGSELTSLHEVRSGRLIAALGDEPEPRTTVDEATGTVVVTGLDGYRAARAFDLDSGNVRWEDDGSGGMLDITLADHGVGYGTRSGRSVAIDLATGRTLGNGDWQVPVAASAAGVLVSALPPDPAAKPSNRIAGAGPGYVAYRRQ